MSQVKYTFDDWLENKFVLERMPNGQPVLNDSSNYQFLVFDGKLDYPTWNKIQEAQQAGYLKMIDNRVIDIRHRYEKKLKEIKTKSSSVKRLEEYKQITLKEIQNFTQLFPNHYNVIIKNHLTRGMSYGAKFVTARQYKNPPILPDLEGTIANKITNHYHDPSQMFEGEIEYVLMEANLIFRDWLENERFANIEGKGFATFLFHRTGFIAPAKNNKAEWEKVLQQYGFAEKLTPATIGVVFNKISKSANRIDPQSDKNLTDALKLFKEFPDTEGVKKLQKEIEEQKKGTVPA